MAGAVAGAVAGADVAGRAPGTSAAAWTAFSASTVPAPYPAVVADGGRGTLPLTRASRTWLLVSAGSCERIRAAIPATTALAASVVLILRYPAGGLAVVTFTPGAVSATYDCRAENAALTK